jgi:hypothetical protein
MCTMHGRQEKYILNFSRNISNILEDRIKIESKDTGCGHVEMIISRWVGSSDWLC